ncbi:MAG TPA: galactokinase [Thermoanaerobaculia bacterium]|nr:galactokinase [Thermoanaerobaculia bacterium]
MIDPERVRRAFRDRHGREPRLFRAPGRVNLIGEHTDYNDGFVLPMAVERDTVVAAAPRAGHTLRVTSLNRGEEETVDLAAPPRPRRGTWLDYVEGTARVLEEEVGALGGADLVLLGDVPEGGGLSSSASLETAVGLALAALSGRTLDPRRLALAAQAAEHRFVGIRCGIMDQLTAVLGRAGHALLIDCRSLDVTPIPLQPGRAAVLVCDSGVHHRLAASAYNERRAACEETVARLAAAHPEWRALRDVPPAELERHAGLLPPPLLARARHVVSEMERTLQGAEALAAGELAAFGRLMLASHRSLRDDYEVSVPELDLLVEAAAAVEGVYGSRLTGGGFGGCTVTLVRPEAVARAGAALEESFSRRFGRRPEWFVTAAAPGAEEI